VAIESLRGCDSRRLHANRSRKAPPLSQGPGALQEARREIRARERHGGRALGPLSGLLADGSSGLLGALEALS
jgi:hypothetical protein